MTASIDRQRFAEAIALVGDLSLRELDRLSGHALTLASKTLSGANANPSLAVASAWAEVLGLSLDWLAGRKAPAPDPLSVRAAVLESRKRYAAEHPPRGRKGAGRRILSIVSKAQKGRPKTSR